jgi:hypothetical protein
MEALVIKCLGGGEVRKVAQANNATLVDGDVAEPHAILIDDGATLQNEIN